MIIEGISYKQVNRKDYHTYLKECTEAGVAPSFKSISGVVWYKCAIQPNLTPDNAIKNSESDLVTNKKEFSSLENASNSILSAAPLTTPLKASIKKVFTDFKLFLFSNISGKTTLYQYCENCNTETSHYKTPNIVSCSRCKKGYMIK